MSTQDFRTGILNCGHVYLNFRIALLLLCVLISLKHIGNECFNLTCYPSDLCPFLWSCRNKNNDTMVEEQYVTKDILLVLSA